MIFADRSSFRRCFVTDRVLNVVVVVVVVVVVRGVPTVSIPNPSSHSHATVRIPILSYSSKTTQFCFSCGLTEWEVHETVVAVPLLTRWDQLLVWFHRSEVGLLFFD